MIFFSNNYYLLFYFFGMEKILMHIYACSVLFEILFVLITVQKKLGFISNLCWR